MGEDMPHGPCPECGKPIQMYGNMDNPGKTGAGYECPDLDCPHPPDVKYESDDPVQPDKMPPYDEETVRRREAAKMRKAFRTGWSVISKKSWDDMTEEEDSGWTDNPMECRGCGHILSDSEWEQKRCPECGTRNTVHPMFR